jgi:hypothetical protein
MNEEIFICTWICAVIMASSFKEIKMVGVVVSTLSMKTGAFGS